MKTEEIVNEKTSERNKDTATIITIPNINETVTFVFEGKGTFATYPSVVFNAFLCFLKDRNVYKPSSDLAEA